MKILVDSFPLHLDTLGPGSIIDGEEIARHSGFRFGTQNYGLYQMQLCHRVMDELGKLGIPVIARRWRRAVRVLTPIEASKFERQEDRRHLRRFVRNHERKLATDTSEFDPKDVRSHLRSIEVSAAMVAGFREEPKIRRIAYKRNTPGLESWPTAE